MNELSSLGLILLLALMAGHLVKYIRVPEVTGYLLAGVALGPSVLGWVSHENLTALEIFSEVALGLILFSIGSVFEFGLIRRIGRNVLLLTLIESLLACATVIAVMLLGGQEWQVALLLGVIAMETAAASTLMVMRECNAEGPVTETLTGILYTLTRPNSSIKVHVHKTLPTLKYDIEIEISLAETASYETWASFISRLETGVIVQS